jgi:hypothetical protein
MNFSTAITAMKVESDLEQALQEAGVESPMTKHYGELKSTEAFEDERIGLLAGCISPRSGWIKDWLALLGKEATPRREVEDDYHGQDWVGKDAGVAMELLADVREKQVLQAAGRYARSPADPDDEATVWVMTNVLQSQHTDRETAGVKTFSGNVSEILSVVADAQDAISPAEIAESVDVSKKYVYEVLGDCEDASWMHVERTEGHNNPTMYYLDEAPAGLADI